MAMFRDDKLGTPTPDHYSPDSLSFPFPRRVQAAERMPRGVLGSMRWKALAP